MVVSYVHHSLYRCRIITELVSWHRSNLLRHENENQRREKGNEIPSVHRNAAIPAVAPTTQTACRRRRSGAQGEKKESTPHTCHGQLDGYASSTSTDTLLSGRQHGAGEIHCKTEARRKLYEFPDTLQVRCRMAFILDSGSCYFIFHKNGTEA
jgi:hypothetical protein